MGRQAVLQTENAQQSNKLHFVSEISINLISVGSHNNDAHVAKTVNPSLETSPLDFQCSADFRDLGPWIRRDIHQYAGSARTE